MARTDWRDLPPVEPIDPPRRLSQTLLKHADRCMRSAYLYLKHGSPPSVELDRGSAFHLFVELAMKLLVEQGEPRLEPDVAKDLVEAVLTHHPELGVTAEDARHLREQAYHWAIGFDPQPETVLAVERLFALDIAGWTFVGKVDLARLVNGVLEVRDWKTSLHVPRGDEYAGSFQTGSYAALILFGQPVTEQPDGTMLREPGFGAGIEWVRTAEMYPRYLTDDRTLVERSHVLSRADVSEFLTDLERIVGRVTGALQSWRWPAIRGTHCSECPAVAECPLPAVLRPHAGEINTIEQASEALEWAEATSARVSATRKEVQRFAQRQQLVIPVGADEQYGFYPVTTTRRDDQGLMEAIARARLYGEPLELERFIRRSTSTRFKKVRRETEPRR